MNKKHICIKLQECKKVMRLCFNIDFADYSFNKGFITMFILCGDVFRINYIFINLTNITIPRKKI